MHNGTFHKPNKILLLTHLVPPRCQQHVKQALLVLVFKDGNLRESLAMGPWAAWHELVLVGLLVVLGSGSALYGLQPFGASESYILYLTNAIHGLP